jgi:hypothetical protein
MGWFMRRVVADANAQSLLRALRELLASVTFAVAPEERLRQVVERASCADKVTVLQRVFGDEGRRLACLAAVSAAATTSLQSLQSLQSNVAGRR